jgi:hypothetical protein
MSLVVFTGPTLSAEEVSARIDAVCLPPVAQGDVYRVAQQKPRAIGIIDGYFQGVPSVWHKEILWAMAKGIHVFGSASMGALRAAELASFGMTGVGRIFEDYRAGRLLDDDEVAVLHAPAELAFKPLSEPMVNVRATLAQAVAGGLLGETTAAALCRIAKARYYADRTWDDLLTLATAEELPAAELQALAAWLPEGRRDQKREDALAMIEALRGFLDAPPEPKQVDYDFEWTDVWQTLSHRWLSEAASDGERGETETETILDELRLEGDDFAADQGTAVYHLLALREAERSGRKLDDDSLDDLVTDYRSQLGLQDRDRYRDWLRANRLSEEAFAQLVADEVAIDGVEASLEVAAREQLIAALRLRGDYARLLQRAGRKRAALAAFGQPHPGPEDTGLTPPALVEWYFTTCLDRGAPSDLDGYIEDIGLSSRRDFYRILAREYLYLKGE